jgi:hypothetical protein
MLFPVGYYAVQQVKDYVSVRVIILFGPGDVKSMIHGGISFDHLLNEKYNALISRRIVQFK